MSYSAWSKKDVDTLIGLSNSNKSMDEIRKKLGRSNLSIINQLKRLGKGIVEEVLTEEPEPTTPNARRSKLEKAAINFLDRRLKDKDYKNVWASILTFQDALQEKLIEQKEVNIEIATNKWIGVAIVGDLHIGNMATDYKTMLYHRDLMAKTPNLYVMLNGDYCDNFLPTSHPDGMFEALFPPAVQKNIAKDYVDAIKEKVLVIVSGDHEAFGIKASDFDLSEYLSKHGDAAYLGNGGIVYLKVGNVEYKINIRHRYKYSSAENATSTVKKLFEKCGGFDVGVTGHNHVAAMEEAVKEGADGYKKRLFIRSGTYKTSDRYGKLLGFSQSDIGVPVVLFNPKTRDIRGFSEITEGIEYLSYLNGKKQ